MDTRELLQKLKNLNDPKIIYETNDSYSNLLAVYNMAVFTIQKKLDDKLNDSLEDIVIELKMQKK